MARYTTTVGCWWCGIATAATTRLPLVLPHGWRWGVRTPSPTRRSCGTTNCCTCDGGGGAMWLFQNATVFGGWFFFGEQKWQKYFLIFHFFFVLCPFFFFRFSTTQQQMVWSGRYPESAEMTHASSVLSDDGRGWPIMSTGDSRPEDVSVYNKYSGACFVFGVHGVAGCCWLYHLRF